MQAIGRAPPDRMELFLCPDKSGPASNRQITFAFIEILGNSERIQRSLIQHSNKSMRTLHHLSLTLSLACSTLATAQSTKPYEIYPLPQKIEYQKDSFTISGEVNVVYEKGIDVYTKKRLRQILDQHGIDFTVGKKGVSGKTNILVGINRSGGVVDRFFNKRVKHSEAFFEKNDSHIVSVNNNVIAVLGDDTDSAFYGVTTLKHVFNQLEKKQIREFRVDDFSHVKHRGFIEGYYGNPWSNEDRAELMKFGGDYKLNTYFFAPKDDIYHNKKWRELYPPKELAEIKKLAQVGNETKNKYVYALHTFMHQPVRFDNEKNYQHDLDIIKAKFTQLLENDVRAFSILADDAGVPRQGPGTYVKLLKDVTKWLIEQKKNYPDLVTDVPFCPNDYMGNGSSAQLREVNKSPNSVSIIMTGGRIWGEVSEGFTSRFIQNIASTGHKGRASYLWINWPCSDNSKQHLILGGNDIFLHPQVNPDNIQGIILNPMQQAEANKSALFAIADYSWNVWDSKQQADQNWHDSFKHMDHGTAEETKASTALRTIARHMINQNMDGRVRALQESLELAPKLDAFKKKLKAGRVTTQDTAALISEFQSLQRAAATYKKTAGNTRDQINHWLHCWQDTTTAAINYLKCLDAISAGDNDAIWKTYSTAHTAFEKSKSHKFRYVNHYEYAEVGVQHIVPFIKTLGAHTGGIVSGIINPTKTTRAYITSREAAPSGKLDSVLDGEPKTGVVYKNPTRIEKGEYVGLSYNNPKHITGVEFHLGTNANPKDTFSKARIEVTQDGKTWKPLSAQIYSLPDTVKVDGLDIHVRGIRMTATEAKGNSWLGVRDIIIKQENPSANTITNTSHKLSAVVGMDLAKLTPVKGIKLKQGGYVGLKLGRIKDLKRIGTRISNNDLTIQVSANAIEWQSVSGGELPDARYIRLINETEDIQAVDIDTLMVHSSEIQPMRMLKAHAPLHRGAKPGKAYDGDFNSTDIFGKAFSEGDAIVYDFGQPIQVDNLKYVVLDTEVDHIRDAKFQLSADGKTWKDAFQTSRKSDDASAKPQDNGYTHGSLSNGIIPISHSYLEGKDLNTKARYFRILATKSYHHRWVRVSEILINNGQYIRTTNDPTYTSTPIEQKGHEPGNMFDGDLTTSYKPNTDKGKIKQGTVIYQLSENTAVRQINIVQDGNAISNARVMVRTGANDWSLLGKLDKSLNQLKNTKHKHILEIKIEWNGVAPAIYEVAILALK